MVAYSRYCDAAAGRPGGCEYFSCLGSTCNTPGQATNHLQFVIVSGDFPSPLSAPLYHCLTFDESKALSPTGQNSQVARQNHLILAKTPFTKHTSRRPPLTAHPNPPRRPAVRRTKTARSDARKIPFGGALSQPRPQATASDRRRPQATAGDRRRASASAATNKKRLDYMGLKRHPALSQRLGTSRTSERRRWAEASGDRVTRRLSAAPGE